MYITFGIRASPYRVFLMKGVGAISWEMYCKFHIHNLLCTIFCCIFSTFKGLLLMDFSKI